MNSLKRLIALFFLGLFSAQTIASVYPGKSDSFKSSTSENAAYFKSVISTTCLLSETNSKNQISENPDFRSVNSLDWFCTDVYALPGYFIDPSVFENFNLYKGSILSSVNLIFPFQYFW